MSEVTIEQMQESIDNYRGVVELGDALERLYDNKDFQKVIVEGYMRDHASDLAVICNDMRFPKEKREETIDLLKGISCFSQFLQVTFQKANAAQGQIDAGLEEINEMRKADEQEI